ncbi:MAG: hypothetical protein ACI33P_16535 [Lysinibacillus sp.]
MKRLYFMICIGAFAVLLAACSKATFDTEQYIVVDKRVGEENQFEDFNEVTDRDQVDKALAILEEANWEKAKVEMVRYPDYRFGFQYKDPKIEAKAVEYKLWISPKGDKIELVRPHEYVQLDKDASAQLFEILTGEKLTGQ